MSDLVTDLRRAVAAVADPELPFLTIEDLGILRDVRMDEEGEVTVTVTPTYTGCPATEVIQEEIRRALAGVGVTDPRVRTVFSPPWSTDDITPTGLRKLEEAGIALPRRLGATTPILCPRCRHGSVQVLSEFGSTPCKALMVCAGCGDPFDHFKEI